MAALAKERSLWLSRPDRLIRAARHYEGAAQILIRHAVMTAKEVSERCDTYCVVLLGHGMGVQDKGTICSQNSALEAFLVCRCSTSPGNTLQVKHLQHCQTHQNLRAETGPAGKYLSVKYFVRLSVRMAVCMSVTFCILCMRKLYMYICICVLSIVETGVLNRCSHIHRGVRGWGGAGGGEQIPICGKGCIEMANKIANKWWLAKRCFN